MLSVNFAVVHIIDTHARSNTQKTVGAVQTVSSIKMTDRFE